MFWIGKIFVGIRFMLLLAQDVFMRSYLSAYLFVPGWRTTVLKLRRITLFKAPITLAVRRDKEAASLLLLDVRACLDS